MECKCEKFQQGNKSLMSAETLAWTHGWHYEGETWKYCPWCGIELEKGVMDAVLTLEQMEKLANLDDVPG